MQLKKTRSRREDAQSMKRNARDRLLCGDYKKAKDEYRMAVLLDPRLFPDVILDYERALESADGNIPLRLSLADLYLRLSDVPSALIELEEILDISPKMESVYNVLGQILMSMGAVDETIELLERAHRHDLRSTALSEMLAGAYLEGGDVMKSIGLYEEILSRDPESKNTLRVLAELYFRVDRPLKSAETYARLFEVDPSTYGEVVHKFAMLTESHGDKLTIREILAGIYLKGNDPDRAVDEFRKIYSGDRSRASEAITRFKRALGIYPGHPGLVESLADALLLNGSYTESAIEYNKLVKLGGDHVKAAIRGLFRILSAFPDHFLTHQFLGDAYSALGKYDEALEEYRAVLALDPREADTVAKKCREFLKIKPELIALHQVLGDIYLIKKDYKKALIEAGEILASDQENIDACLLLGDAYSGLGQHSKSAESYRMALNLDPCNIDIHSKLRAVRAMEVADSIKSLKARIKQDQWRKSLHLDLAKLHIELMEWDLSMKELQEALRDQVRAPFAYNLMGLTLKEQGKLELAVSQFKRALENLPDELKELEKAIRFNLAIVYEALGSVEEALSLYQAVREMDVSFGKVEARIAYLSGVNPQSLRDRMFAMVLRESGGGDLFQVWGRDGRRVHHGKRGGDFGISFAQTHNEKGYDYMVKGLEKSAEEEFLLAMSLDSRLPSALNNHAVIRAHQKLYDEAESKLKAALQDDPKHAVLHNNLGVVCCLKGDFKTAEVELLRALSIDPELAVASINLGDAYYSQGNARQAVARWEKVKEYTVVSDLASRRLKYRTSDHQ